MKVRIVGAYGTMLKGYGLTTFLFDGKLLLDSGAAGYGLSLDEVRKLEAVLLTHTHIDHAGGLMLLADALAIPRRRTLPVYAMPVVIEAVMKNLFNNMTWPDFTRLPSPKEPAIRFEPIQEEVPFKVGKYTVQAVRVDHSVPTTAFFVSDSRATVLNTSDTGPTVRVWDLAKEMKALKGVLVECSFPNSLQNLADRSGHLTPRTLRNEVEKSGLKVPFLVYHLKVPFLKALQREIGELRHPLIKLAVEGRTYTF
jgi:ribonuclease BN (tRNA processing enzyme)